MPCSSLARPLSFAGGSMGMASERSMGISWLVGASITGIDTAAASMAEEGEDEDRWGDENCKNPGTIVVGLWISALGRGSGPSALGRYGGEYLRSQRLEMLGRLQVEISIVRSDAPGGHHEIFCRRQRKRSYVGRVGDSGERSKNPGRGGSGERNSGVKNQARNRTVVTCTIRNAR